MNNKLRSAIIGGVVLGLLSGLPYLRLVNIICCLWIIAGGALAVYLYIKKSPVPVNTGEGAQIGAIAGAIGTFVELFIGLPLTILMGNPEIKLFADFIERVDPRQAEQFRLRIESLMHASFAEQFIYSVFSLQTLINLLITILFALIGGLIAVPLFEKRKTVAGPPPPPPYFDGGPGGAYPPPPPPPSGYGPSSE